MELNKEEFKTLASPKVFFEAIAGPVLYDEESPYKLMTQKLNDIDVDYFEGTIPLGKTVNQEIEIDIKRRILGEFVSQGNALLNSRMEGIIKTIVDNVSVLIDRYPSREAALYDMNEAFVYIHRFARKHLCFVPIPMYDNAELRELYAAAKKVTFLERMTGSNDKDVIKYYHALIEHTVWACRMLMRRRASQFLMQMVDMLSREFDMQSPVATLYNDAPQSEKEIQIPQELMPLIMQMAENAHCDRDTCVRILQFLLKTDYEIKKK